MQQQHQSSLPAPGIALEHKLVCMVNNMYMGVNQIPVEVRGKTLLWVLRSCLMN